MYHPVAKIVGMLRSGELAERYRSLVMSQAHPAGGLVVLNYTRECAYGRAWDDVTIHCRGLVVDTRSWEVAAWPFPKFFNLNERPETQSEALPREPFTAFEKLDGSLGVLLRGPDGLIVATRGSFTSEQSRRGTAALHRLDRIADIPDHLTLLFEIIYPENRTVVRYGYDGLVLLAGYDRRTGAELPWDEVRAWGERLGCRLPAVYPFGTLEEVLRNREALPGDVEGYVLRFASGLRVKLKGDAYLELHRLLWGLSEARVFDALAGGTYEDLLRDLPEEFRPEVEVMATRFRAAANATEAEARRWFAAAPAGADRKTFALWVQANVPRPLYGPLFQLFDGRTVNWFPVIRK